MESNTIAIKDSTANPAPLGLLAFGTTTVLLNLHNAGIFELNSMILAMGIFYGGLAQVVAGIMEWKKNNTFGTTAFTSYGFFWLTLVGLIVMPKLGWVAPASETAMVAYLIIWGIFTLCLFFGTLRISRALQVVFATLFILFFLLAAGDATGNASLKTFTGYEGIFCGASAIYTGVGALLNEVYGKTVLPLESIKALIKFLSNLKMHKPINTALCSFGASGWVFHAPFLKVTAGFNLYAVWERSKNLAEKKYPRIKTYRTLEDLLADDLIELVIVNTPNATHYEYTKKSLEANKHVVVEKPFTITSDEGNELIEIAKKRNRKLSVYQNRRFDSDFKTIKKVLQQELLGDVVEVEMHFDRFKQELGPKLHKETPGPGSGSLYDLGSHLIDQALQLYGTPKRIFADVTAIRPISKVDDYFEVLMFYDGLRIRLHSSYAVREALPGYIFYGLRGSFIKSKTNIQEEMLQAGETPDRSDWGREPISERGFLHTEINGKIVKEYIESERGNYGEYYNGIYESIRNDAPLPVTAEDGVKVIKVIEAAYKSKELKKIIDF